MIRLFRVSIPETVIVLLFSDAILLYTCFTIAAFAVLDVDPEVFLRYDNGWVRIAIGVLSVMAGLYFLDLYTEFRIKSKAVLVQQAGLSVGVAFLVQALLVYLGRQDLFIPTWLMIAGGALALVLVPLWRIFYGQVAFRAIGSERVLFLGASSIVQEICAHWIEHPETGRRAIGCLDDGAPDACIRGVPLLGAIGDVREIVDRLHPARIVVGMPERRHRLPLEQLLELRLAGVHIEDAAAAYESTFSRISTRELRPAQLIFSSDLGPNPKRVLLQSVYSTAIAAVAALLAAPLMLLIAIAVKLTSRGPVLFRQQRVGRNDVPFTLYKFRSMIQNAEQVSGAVWAVKGDPRVTGFGRWLRRLRLDELPQLFNVLKGDMSMVGPRPERGEFVAELEQHIPFYRQRHCVKPGITGWAQINHKYGDTIEDTIAKLEYDLYYIKNLSPALDALILFHTAKVMLLSRGSQ
jgi:exopolysaccharide biosynthesis polyprenyl glycosylphosphotransferase